MHATKVLFCASGLLAEQKRTTLHNLISPDDQRRTNDNYSSTEMHCRCCVFVYMYLAAT